MTFETRFTWEKLALELKLLRNEDFESLVPLCVGIHSVLWPKDGVESCFRQVQFLGFELMKTCEPLSEAERWEALRSFLFDDKGFQISAHSAKDTTEKDVLIKCVLDERSGHPLAIGFLLLHLAHFLDLPLALLEARHHYLLKWVRSGKTIYLDLYNEGRALSDQELIKYLNCADGTLETWGAKQLIEQYLELLRTTFETAQDLSQLHVVLNLMLQMDDTNIDVLGQRALVRQRLGFAREAHADLKRYFSFVERTLAPEDLQQAWLELEKAPEPRPRQPTDVLH